MRPGYQTGIRVSGQLFNSKLTNGHASGTDEKARIIPATIFSLEEALEYIKADEYVEVTPLSMRMRKVILDHLERKRAGR